MPTSPSAARIVFLDRATVPPHIRFRAPEFAHDITWHDQSAPDEVAARIADADIVVVNKIKLQREHINAAPKLKMVAIAATGTDNVDLAACRERGIVVSNIRHYAEHTVPEHTFALILALQRNLLAWRDSVKAGRWQQSGQFCYFDYPIRDLFGATLGIIGAGALGKVVGRLGEAFGMRVLYAARKGATDATAAGYTPFEHVLRESDVLTLHLPLRPETRGLIGAAEFALMTKRPLLINTARGGIVDEAALAQALRTGQIAGAGFDVTVGEPPPADSIIMSLLEHPNFILTPHVAWASDEAMQSLADQLIDNIEAAWRGEPRNLVE